MVNYCFEVGQVVVRNRLFYIHKELELQFGRKITQEELGEIIGGYRKNVVNRWLSHGAEPGVDTLLIWLTNLRKYFPNLHMEDLIQHPK